MVNTKKMGPVVVQNFRPVPTSVMQYVNVDEVVREMVRRLEPQTAFIHSGTLLGWWRNGRPIDHDTDIDIAVPVPDGKRPRPLNLARYKDMQPVATVTHTATGRIMKTAYEFNGVCVDIEYFYYDSPTAAWECYLDHGVLVVPGALLGSIARTNGVPYPGNPDAFLRHRFGEGWHTPHGRKLPWQDGAANLVRYA